MRGHGESLRPGDGIVTILEDFYETYLHYTVAVRLWADTCRQLLEFKGTADERQAVVDETLRLAICVTDNINDTEMLIADTLEFIQSEDMDKPDLLEAISLITNNLKEDRARADDYTKFITGTRIGSKPRRPRKPQVANPFVPIVEQESEESEQEDVEPDDTETGAESVESEDTETGESPADESDNGEESEGETSHQEEGGPEKPETDPVEEESGESLEDGEADDTDHDPATEEQEPKSDPDPKPEREPKKNHRFRRRK